MKLRHKTTTATIGETQWNEDHTLATHALGTLGATVTIDLANGSLQTATLGANLTITLPSVAANTTEHLTLLLTNDGTAGRSVTITDIKWVTGTAPTFDTGASKTNIIVLRGTSAGWIGDGGSYA